jgi:hypothetical protein
MNSPNDFFKTLLEKLSQSSQTGSAAKRAPSKYPKPDRACGKQGKVRCPRDPFTAHMRMPDWHSDAIVDLTDENWLELFPEEGLGIVKPKTQEGIAPFLIKDFLKDSSKPWETGWLGGSLPTAGVNPSKFNEYLLELAARARIYNFLLYFLRLSHTFHDFKKEAIILPDEDDALKEHLELIKLILGTSDPTDPPNEAICNRLETCWQEAARDLNCLLEEKEFCEKGFKNVYADLIQVNGFIVSMRVVATQKEPSTLRRKPLDQGAFEVSGSSSHVSLNRPFLPIGFEAFRNGLAKKDQTS